MLRAVAPQSCEYQIMADSPGWGDVLGTAVKDKAAPRQLPIARPGTSGRPPRDESHPAHNPTRGRLPVRLRQPLDQIRVHMLQPVPDYQRHHGEVVAVGVKPGVKIQAGILAQA